MSSKLIGDPVRIQLRDLDNLPGKYPLIVRTGKRLGIISSSFDDTNTILFSSGVSINYSQILPSESRFVISQSDIDATGNVVKGVSDYFVSFSSEPSPIGPYVEDGQGYYNQTSFYLTGTRNQDFPGFTTPLASKTSIEFEITSNETQVLTRYSSKRGDGLDPSGFFAGQDLTGFCYYNFALKRWEQVGLIDPQTGNSIHYDFALERGSSDVNVLSGTGNFPMQFLPCNAYPEESSESREGSPYARIGTPTITAFAPFGNKYHATSSQTIKMSEFISEPFLLEKVVVSLPIEAEKKDGHFFLGDQFRVPQNDYVFFIYRQDKTLFSPDDVNEGITGRNTVGKDNLNAYVTGTTRYLICSGVITFYNNVAPLPDKAYSYSIVNTPAFSHDWNIDPYASGASTAISATFSGTVELNIIPAVASAQMLGYSRVPRSDGDFPSSTNNTMRMWHYWPGGTSCFPFGPSGSHGKFSSGSEGDGASWSNLGGIVSDNTSFGTPTYIEFAQATNGVLLGGLPSYQGAKDNLSIEKLDPRTFKPLGGNNSQVTGEDATGGRNQLGEQSSPSPYILLPEDELIFGLEAATGLNGRMSANEITGSFMRITTKPAKITFYGSLLSNGREFHHGLNQSLTSHAISEAIGSKKPLDQFLIANRENYIGSNRSRVLGGSIFGTGNINSLITDDSLVERQLLFDDASSERVVEGGALKINYDLIVLNQPIFPLPSSFIDKLELPRRRFRFFECSSKSERFFDTLLPQLDKYLIRAGAVRTGSYVFSSDPSSPSSDPGNDVRSLANSGTFFKFEGADVTLDSDGNTVKIAELKFLEQAGNHLPYPYDNNPVRSLKEKEIFLVISKSDSSNGNYAERSITSYSGIKYLLFTRGYRSYERAIIGIENTSIYGPPLFHEASGAMSNKYGIQGILPLYSKAVFRTDHYGHFRDMLEQRQFGIFYDEEGISNNLGLGKKGKKQGPITVKFLNPAGELKLDGGGRAVFSGSSNRSFEATSSLPYVDGQYSNWTDVV